MKVPLQGTSQRSLSVSMLRAAALVALLCLVAACGGGSSELSGSGFDAGAILGDHAVFASGYSGLQVLRVACDP